MRLRDFLTEAPIQDFEIQGDLDTPGSFRADDLKKFRDPKWKERVVRLFSRSPHPINLYIVNGNAEGKVTMRGKTYIDTVKTQDKNSYVGLQSRAWAESILGHPVGSDTDITAMLLTNEGDERVGLTPWMVAHRIAHCFLENNPRERNTKLQSKALSLAQHVVRLINQIERYFSDYHPERMKEIGFEPRRLTNEYASLLSDFNSAKSGHLRDVGEYVVELMAEFLIKGEIIFKTNWLDGDPRRPNDNTPLEQAVIDLLQSDQYGELSSIYRTNAAQQKFVSRLYAALRGNPHRPRTKAEFSSVLVHMADEGKDFYGPRHDWSPEERIYFWVKEAETKINKLMAQILEFGVGQVVVL